MLKAGFARLDVTPPLGTDISGYFLRRIANGILDPLYLNALAVSNGEDTLLLLAVDYIGILMKYADPLREAISERTGVPTDHILLAALHQHTSPCIGDPDLRYTIDPTWHEIFTRKCADAAQMAIADLDEATLGSAEAPTPEPIAFVRRYFLDDGSVETNPSSALYDRLTERCAEADNTVRLLRFARKDKKDIALVNFSTHPDVIGGTKFSADWCGFVRTYVEQTLEDVSCIFFTGTQGDSNHLDFFKPKEERGGGYKHAKYMGRTVADVALSLWDRTRPVQGDRILAEFRVIYNRTNLEGVEQYDEKKRFLDEYYAAEKAGNRPYHHITRLAYATRVVNLRKATIFRPIPLTVLGFGDVRFVGFGGEAFTEYGAIARSLAPDQTVLCAVCANGYEGYFPTEKAFSEGGYETSSSLYTPTLEREITAALKEMLQKS